jgi:hypothetical protein
MSAFQNIDFNKLMDVVGYETRKVVESDRADVQQNIFERLLKQLKKNPDYATTEKQIGGLCRDIARKAVADYFRHINTLKVSSTACVFFADPVDEREDSAADSFYATTEEIGYELVNLRLDFYKHQHAFSPQERRVIEHKLTEEGLDMSWADISAELGINKSHASRAKAKFENVVLAG